MQKKIKQEVTEIYESPGMDLPTALCMFMNKSRMVKGIPFDVRLPENAVTRTEAMKAFEDLRMQAAEIGKAHSSDDAGRLPPLL